MRNLLIIINLSIIIGITTILTQSDKMVALSESRAKRSEVVSAGIKKPAPNATYEKISSLPAVDDEVQDFLKEMAEARMIDLEQGNTASQRATTRPLKDYGILMVRDQTEMLKQLQAIAKRKQVSIPFSVGPDKAGDLSELKELHGKNFDKKFIRMMINDHKSDLKKLQRAIRSDDADVKVFATRYLPMVEAHLDKIKALKKLE